MRLDSVPVGAGSFDFQKAKHMQEEILFSVGLDIGKPQPIFGEYRGGFYRPRIYLRYQGTDPRPEMQESDYTVVSNSNRFGMPPVESAAYIAELIPKMLREKASGLHFKP